MLPPSASDLSEALVDGQRSKKDLPRSNLRNLYGNGAAGIIEQGRIES